VRKRYAALSPHQLVEQPNRGEAIGTPTNDSTKDETSIIVITVASIIVITLTRCSSHRGRRRASVVAIEASFQRQFRSGARQIPSPMNSGLGPDRQASETLETWADRCYFGLGLYRQTSKRLETRADS
jgi:hypothetical protein